SKNRNAPVSLADFDVIARFCEAPDVLIHYIHRRTEMQQSEKNIFADELDLFGTYLDARLEPANSGSENRMMVTPLLPCYAYQAAANALTSGTIISLACW